MDPFTILEHPSDVGIEVYGTTKEELFVNAARGMYAILLENGVPHETVKHSLQLQGRDLPNLLLLWLNELLFLFESRRFVLATVEYHIFTPAQLACTVHGEELPEELCRVMVGIKAVTYHHLVVEEQNNGWFGRVYFDV